jgi:ketosteroid isomerase-like protein
MKKIKLLSSVVLSAIVFTTGIAFSQSASDYKTKIESLNREMAKNMVAGTSDKIISLYTEDAVSMPSYSPIQDGLAAIKKANEEMMKSGWKCLSFEPTTLKVIPNGNMVTEIGTYKIRETVPGNDKPMEDHGKYVTIWEKQKDGSLKIKVETWNTDVNPMSNMKTADQPKADKKN